MVKESDRLAFWAERVRSFTEIKTLSRQLSTSRVIRRSKWRRHLYVDPLEEPTIHVEHLLAATPDSRHDWRRIDPLTSIKDLWPTFQALARTCGEDTLAVIGLPHRRVSTDSRWQWGPYFTIDRMMVAGSGGSWCLIYTEVPDIECWVTTTDRAPQGARELLLQA